MKNKWTLALIAVGLLSPRTVLMANAEAPKAGAKNPTPVQPNTDDGKQNNTDGVPQSKPAGSDDGVPPSDDVTGADQSKKAVQTGDAGKGSSPDPGTGKTFDFRQMLLNLLGLDDTADEVMINTAYKACMATEPDAYENAIQGKMNDAMTAKDQQVKSANEKAEGLQKQLDELTSAANESKGEHDGAIARAERAEGAFANERNAHAKTIAAFAVVSGKLSKANAANAEKQLANAKTGEEFATIRDQIIGANSIFSVTSTTSGLDRTSAPGTASQQFTEMVNESMAQDTGKKHNYDWHYSKVAKSEKGKALIAEMKQPAKQS